MKPGERRGWLSVSPVLVVKSVEAESAFLRTVFQAEVGMLIHGGHGEVQRAEARISNSVLVLQRASATLAVTRSMTRLPMSDVQATIQRALDNGGTTFPLQGFGLGEQDSAAVTDPEGHVWWIVPQDRKPSSEEVQRRLSEQRRQRL